MADEALDSGLPLNIFRPAEFAKCAQCSRRFGVGEPFCIDRRQTASALK